MLAALGKGSWPLLLALLLPLHPAEAQADRKLGEYWGLFGTLDYLSWDGLGDLEPLGRGGPFKTSGSGIELGGYASVAQIGSVLMLAGIKLGHTGFNHNAIFQEDAKAESAMELNYISGELRFRFGEPRRRYIDLEFGLGSYVADSKYIDCSVIVSCFAADTRASDAALQLGVSAMLGHGVLVGVRVHNVDFAPIEAIDLRGRPVKGPVYALLVGWEFSNWTRN